MAKTSTQSQPKARPLSPHLQIYRWKIPMLTSILHRMTGVALVFGSLVIVWWLVAAAMGIEQYGVFVTGISHPLGKLVMIGWTWAFWYQMLNGMRHLFWDAGYGFKLKTAFTTGAIVLALSLFFTGLTWAKFYTHFGETLWGDGQHVALLQER